MLAEMNMPGLQAQNVTHVLCVAEGLRQSHPGHFTYKMIPLDDDEDEDIISHFPACFEFISSAIGETASVCHEPCDANDVVEGRHHSNWKRSRKVAQRNATLTVSQSGGGTCLSTARPASAGVEQ